MQTDCRPKINDENRKLHTIKILLIAYSGTNIRTLTREHILHIVESDTMKHAPQKRLYLVGIFGYLKQVSHLFLCFILLSM